MNTLAKNKPKSILKIPMKVIKIQITIQQEQLMIQRFNLPEPPPIRRC